MAEIYTMKNLHSDNIKLTTMNTQNPKLKAIVSIRNLVCGLSNDWKELKSLGTDIDDLVEITSTKFITNTPVVTHERWMSEIAQIEKNILSLKRIMSTVAEKINARKPNKIAEDWNAYKEYAKDLKVRFGILSDLGKTHLPKGFYEEWERDWSLVDSKFEAIQQLAEGSSLRLSMISEFAPEEVDELTDTILKHMPFRYSMEEALQYEKEYMEAYKELKEQGNKNKNLWDRFLDILAGGIQQSPAERVMMQRWVNGEKGSL